VNTEKFKQTELQYNQLKEKHNAGEISAEEMKKQLKSLMILDDTGRYWMIGGKSGKWYTYNGKEWLESNPYPIDADPVKIEDHHIDTSDNPFPSSSGYSVYGDADDEEHESAQVSFQDSEQATTTIDFSSEHDSEEQSPNYSEHYKQNVYEASPQTRTLSTLVSPSIQIPKVDAVSSDYNPASPVTASKKDDDNTLYQAQRASFKTQQQTEHEIKKMAPPSMITIKQIHLLTAMIFFGGVGSIAGVIFGAMFGIFKILDPLSGIFPLMLVEMRGKVLGGLFFAAIGGLAGFILLALAGALLAMFYNTVASVFCGIRIKIKTE